MDVATHQRVGDTFFQFEWFGVSIIEEEQLPPKPQPSPWALPMAKAHSSWKVVVSPSNTPVVAVVVVRLSFFLSLLSLTSYTYKFPTTKNTEITS
jgi:hypothetical protein